MISGQDGPAPPTEPPTGDGDGSHDRAWSLIHEDGSEAALREATRRLAEHLAGHPADAEAFGLLSASLLGLGRAEESLEAALEAAKLSRDAPEPCFRAGLALFELAALAEEAEDGEDGEDDLVEGDDDLEDRDLGPASGIRADFPATACDETDAPSGGRFLSPTLHFIEAVLEIPAARDATLASQALEMFERAVALGSAPGAPELWAGLCFLNLGRPAYALACFQDASEGDSSLETTADAWFLRGITLEELERDQEAAEAYRVALAHFTDHRGARIRQEWLDAGTRDGFLAAEDVADLCRTVESRLEAALESTLPTGATAEDDDLSAACSGKLEHARRWAEERQIAADRIESFLVYHGAVCDCEVLLNLERRLGLADGDGDGDGDGGGGGDGDGTETGDGDGGG